MKRFFALLLALVMVLSLTGCGKKVTVKTPPSASSSASSTKTPSSASSTKCGTFEISGSLGKSGTIKVTGTVFNSKGTLYDLKNVTYTYKRDGSTVTMTRKGAASAPKTISGTYDSITNTFTLDNKSYCSIYGK